jgi:glutamate synthase (NADPH/NADH) small chain
VTVFERAEKPGGLLRYGIPEFKMEKAVLDRRLAQMEAEGVTFVCSTSIGDAGEWVGEEGEPIEPGDERGIGTACAPDVVVRSAADVQGDFDAVVLAGGATLPRDLPVPGRGLDGVHLALEYLKPSNLVQEGALKAPLIDAKGKRVIIIGGGDTGADCLGTAHRQGAKSVHQLEIMPEPPSDRMAENPWPLWPLILRTSSAHEEGGERVFAVTTTEFVDDGKGALGALRGHEVEMRSESGRPIFEPVPGSEFELEADLVLLAMGFVGTERGGVVAELGLALDPRGAVAADAQWATNVDGVFVCGDQTRGQSLIVWAIAEGRAAAASVDRWLMGTTDLPAPIVPGQLALR